MALRVTLGRKQGEDSQVKIRGQRVELDEIAASIVSCSENMITNAAVSWRPDEELLVALVVLRNGFRKDTFYWSKRQVGQELPFPPYMRPSVWIPASGIPTNANGKADRRAINEYSVPSESKWPPSLPNNSPKAIGSLSDIEKQIATIWGQVLGEKSLGILDSESDFFHMGGNSRNLIELWSLIERQFPPARIPLPLLFQHSSLGEMAAMLSPSHNGQTSQISGHLPRMN